MKYQFIQKHCYFYEVEANSLEEAYSKTAELEADDFYDIIVSEFVECTPNSKG
jgi:hypothetical protein